MFCIMLFVEFKKDRVQFKHIQSERIFFGRATKFLVMKNCYRKVVFVFLILFVLTDAILLNFDLQKRPPLKVGSDLVELIDIDHIFLK